MQNLFSKLNIDAVAYIKFHTMIFAMTLMRFYTKSLCADRLAVLARRRNMSKSPFETGMYKRQ